MKFIEILRLVWLNIIQNKAKMMLTTLGIIVGSATIVLVIAIGRGGQEDVAEQFKNLNAGAIDVTVGDDSDVDAMLEGGMGGMGGMGGGGMSGGGSGSKGSSGSGGGMPSGGGMSSGSGGGMPSGSGGGMPGSSNIKSTLFNDNLDEDDENDISSLITDIDEITLLESGDSTVFGGDMEEESTETVVGVQENYDTVSNLEMLYGRFIEDSDNDETAYVCVLGYTQAQDIFTYAAYAYGDYVEINGKNYEVIGVLSEMGSVSSGISPDTAVYVPYSTAEKYVFGSSDGTKQITVIASDVNNVDSVITDLETVLTENHPNTTFDISDAGSAMEAATSSADTLATLLLAVATIVFIVGGIGIMNVLFVSVKERTQEIGILKAIGCKRKTILLEFLMEANIISVIGGLVGIGLSFGLDPLIELLGTRTEGSVWGYVLALVFAVATGTIFGFYPAYKASKLVPVEALNLE